MPTLRSVWRYTGPAPGMGEHHLVIWSLVDEGEIVTLSPNFMWLGSVEQFHHQFQWVSNPKCK